MPQLIIQEQGRADPLVHTCTEEVITIGRQDDNVVQLKRHGVSRKHAMIQTEGENFFLMDLKSGNGTILNGMRLTPHEKNLLKPGDLINIEKFDIRFHAGELDRVRDLEDEVTESDILEVKLLKKVLTALDKDLIPSLEVLNGSAQGKKILLSDEVTELVIGRDPDCDFPINEYVISRRHAKITKRWGGIAIRDMESKNGVFVNNRRVVEEYLHDGDRIAFGTVVCLFRNPQEINLAYLEEIQPKTRPAPVSPEEIPGLEAPAEEEPMPEGTEPEAGEEGTEEPDAEQWEASEEEEGPAEGHAAPREPQSYPTPQPKATIIKRLTPIEIGMIGLGVLIIIFALITVVNLMTS